MTLSLPQAAHASNPKTPEGLSIKALVPPLADDGEAERMERRVISIAARYAKRPNSRQVLFLPQKRNCGSPQTDEK